MFFSFLVTKHRPQTNNPARMRNRDRETRAKWDDRSTLFPDGLRLKAPVRSQHQDVCRAHACRETTGMTTDHYTRSPDTPPRATASDPHVRARREGEAFAFQPDTPVSSCPSHDPTAQGSLTQTSSCTKKQGEHATTAPQRLWFPQQPRLMARFDTWLHQQPTYFKQFPSDPKLRTVSPT